MPDAPDGYRYWRYVELPGDELISTDLEILRRIDPHGGEPAELDGVDLERAWELAAADIVSDTQRARRSSRRSRADRAQAALGA